MKTCRDFWKWIKENDIKLQHEFHNVDNGDEYHNESGELCRMWFPDKTCVEFGFVKINEWEEDWAEADSQIVFQCSDITDPDSETYLRTIKWEDVYNKIMSLKPKS